MNDDAKDLLVLSLQAAVPLHVNEVRRLSAAAERVRLASSAADIVAAHGDNILYRSKKTGDTANAFNELARGLAILAFQPGGVTFAGCHWEAEPEPQTSPDARNAMAPTNRLRTISDVPLPGGSL